MEHTTYAVTDMNVVFEHPAFGRFVANGKGLTSITFGRATDMSSQDVAADGSVMTSKVVAKNGTVTIVVQQTSPVAKWLTKLNNYLENSPADQFSRTSVSASSKVMGVSHTATGVTPQKQPDTVYAASGATESYAYLAQTVEKEAA